MTVHLDALYAGATIDHFEYIKDERYSMQLGEQMTVHLIDGRSFTLVAAEYLDLIVKSEEIDKFQKEEDARDWHRRREEALAQIREDEAKGLI